MKIQKILHSMLRVTNMQQSIDFYTQVIGMHVLRTLEQPSENYTLVFLGFDEESNASVLELTYNYGVSEYIMGNAFGHIAISVDDCYRSCRDIKLKGGNVIFNPNRLQGSNEIIAFVEDPDGYQIELIQRDK